MERKKREILLSSLMQNSRRKPALAERRSTHSWQGEKGKQCMDGRQERGTVNINTYA